jgi:tetratricopeptide (TPR) repeat protein
VNKRSLQQLLWLLFGVGLLTLLVIAGRNTSTQLVKKEAVQTQDAAPEKSESVSDADLSDIEKPDAYKKALQLFAEAENHSLDEQVDAAIAIDSLASLINNEELIKVLQSKSEELFLIVLEKDPKNLEALNNLALVDIYRKEDVMTGVGRLKKVIELDKNNENALFQLGILSIKSGQTEKAIERFEKLVSLHPKNKEYHKNLALLYNQNGDTQKAEKHAALAK